MTLDPNAAGKGPGYGLMLGGVGLLFGGMILAAGIIGAAPWWGVTCCEVALWIMQEKDVKVAGARQLQSFINPVWRAFTVLRERGDVWCEVESRRVMQWKCCCLKSVGLQQF